MQGCGESRRKGGGTAILHSSIRNQEGLTIEAEETQRQLDPDSGFTDNPLFPSACWNSSFGCMHGVNVCACGYGGQGLKSGVLLNPSLSLYVKFRDSFKLAGQRAGGLETAAPTCRF